MNGACENLPYRLVRGHIQAAPVAGKDGTQVSVVPLQISPLKQLGPVKLLQPSPSLASAWHVEVVALQLASATQCGAVGTHAPPMGVGAVHSELIGSQLSRASSQDVQSLQAPPVSTTCLQVPIPVAASALQ
jgi:hypothetical protein